MGDRKHIIENWSHYYAIALSRPDLKKFASVLQIHYNNPAIDFSNQSFTTKEKRKIIDEKGKEQAIYVPVVKTFIQLIQELSPKIDN